MEVMFYFVLDFHVDLKVFHVGIVRDELLAVYFFVESGANNCLDNSVDYVSHDNRAQAHHVKHIDHLVRVLGSDVSVTNGGDCVETPVERVKILDDPVVVDDSIVGSCIIKPTDYI